MIPLLDGLKLLHIGFDFPFKIAYLIIQEIKGLLVLLRIRDVVVFLFLVGFLAHQLLDKLCQLVLKVVGLLVGKTVLAKIHEQLHKKRVVIADFKTYILCNCVGNFLCINTYHVLGRQTQIVGESTRQFLHKGINRTDTETAVIVDDTG